MARMNKADWMQEQALKEGLHEVQEVKSLTEEKYDPDDLKEIWTDLMDSGYP